MTPTFDDFFYSRRKAVEAAEALAKRLAEARTDRKRVADRVDGYDRDDLGESPDY